MAQRVVGPGEIGEMLGGLSRQRVFQLTSGEGFPPPIAILSIGKIWAYDDVAKWARRHGREIHPVAPRT